MSDNFEKDINDRPIGVFDSGLGGLTVVAELMKRFPSEKIVYLGDNARVPYGTRSPETVRKYAWNCSNFLVKKGLKLLVVACNTASAMAIDSLEEGLDIPVLGVIKAGARSAVNMSRNGKIGVLATGGTVNSGAYIKEIGLLKPSARVVQNAAPLLVPLVEEGWIEGEVPALAVKRYLEPIIKNDVDLLLLGCTHYPILRKVIDQELINLKSKAVVVDSATSMADDVGNILNEKNIARDTSKEGSLDCYSTDLPFSFEELATLFLGKKPSSFQKVDII
ncbi:MAG: glutamate racemase [Deltaproteobacteria bacterium]|nr:glutamate racemase [Deltaproteobacteria bacterium]